MALAMLTMMTMLICVDVGGVDNVGYVGGFFLLQAIGKEDLPQGYCWVTQRVLFFAVATIS